MYCLIGIGFEYRRIVLLSCAAAVVGACSVVALHYIQGRDYIAQARHHRELQLGHRCQHALAMASLPAV